MQTDFRYKVFRGGRGGAKCFALGTPVLMYNGKLKNVEDIIIGDKLMGPDSRPRNVIDTMVGESEMFEINQTSAISYTVNKDHILSLKKSKSCAKDRGIKLKSGNYKCPNGRYPGWGGIVNISVSEYLKQSNRWKENFRGYRAGLIKFKGQKVAIDPYLLGVWLGDGHSRDMVITTADKEIVNYLEKIAPTYNVKATYCTKKGKAQNIGLSRIVGNKGRQNPLKDLFKSYNLILNKHIPDSYISNSENVRLQLLAGLIDTDGTYNGRGSYKITLANKKLIYDVKRLVDSLGFRTTIIKKSTICTNNGVRGVAWAVGINGFVDKIPCKIKRKICHGVKPNKDKTLSYLVVKPAGIGKYYGFSVDSDNLFCLSDGTVTHNSRSFAAALIGYARNGKHRILCCREIQRSIKDSVKRILDDQIEKFGLQEEFESTLSEIRHKRTGSNFIFAGLRSDPDGIKSTEGVDFAWVEEAHTCSQISLDILIPTIRQEGSEIWFSYNPRFDDDPVHAMFSDEIKPPRSCVIDVQYYDNPWFPDVLREEMEFCKTKDFDKYLHVWEGQTVQQSDEQVMHGCWRIEEVPKPPKDAILKYGVDWGFAADPMAVIRSWIQDETMYIDYEAWGKGVKTVDIAAFIDTVPGSRQWPLIGDSARPDTIDFVKDEGFHIKGSKKGKGSIQDGIEYIKGFDVVIDPRCVETISEFIHYKYKKDPHTDNILPIIIDANNHIMDALRYSHEGAYKTFIKGMDLS